MTHLGDADGSLHGVNRKAACILSSCYSSLKHKSQKKIKLTKAEGRYNLLWSGAPVRCPGMLLSCYSSLIKLTKAEGRYNFLWSGAPEKNLLQLFVKSIIINFFSNTTEIPHWETPDCSRPSTSCRQWRQRW